MTLVGVRLCPPLTLNLAAFFSSCIFSAAEVETESSFQAYNDLSWAEDQRFENITRFTTDEGTGTPPDGSGGALVDFVTGRVLSSTLLVEGGSWNGSNHTRLCGSPNVGSDAEGVFGGIVDTRGVISYGTELTLTFGSLDPQMRYQVVLYGDRGRRDYTNRISKATLSGVFGAENRSSLGAAFSGANDESTILANGYNPNGYVARFTAINPGADGTFTVTLSDGGSADPPKQYVNAVCLETVDASSAFVSHIGLSNSANGKQATTEYKLSDTLYINVQDISLDTAREPWATVTARLKQDEREIHRTLIYDEAEGSFLGSAELDLFEEGPIDVEVHGFVDTRTPGEDSVAVLDRYGSIYVTSEDSVVRSNNVLLVLVDDWGIDSSGLYNDHMEATLPPTPAIDSLAANGILFRNAYAQPLCSPTRATILTGRHPFRHGVGAPVSPAESLSEDEFTLPDVFEAAESSYALASFGKWHLTAGQGRATDPNVIGGWPHFSGTLGGGLPDYFNYQKVVNGVAIDVSGYATTETVDDAAAWISLRGSSPWFCWIGFNAAHTPFHRPPQALHNYDSVPNNPTGPARRRAYEASLQALDTELARLLKGIDQAQRDITRTCG